MLRDGATWARSLELTVQWDGIIRIAPVYPLTVQDFLMARRGGLGEWLQVVEGLHRGLSDFIHRGESYKGVAELVEGRSPCSSLQVAQA